MVLPIIPASFAARCADFANPSVASRESDATRGPPGRAQPRRPYAGYRRALHLLRPKGLRGGWHRGRADLGVVGEVAQQVRSLGKNISIVTTVGPSAAVGFRTEATTRRNVLLYKSGLS